MKKFLTMTVLCAAVAVGLSGCGDKKDSAPAQSKQASSTITVGATPVPHADILKFVQPISIAAEGRTVPFTL